MNNGEWEYGFNSQNSVVIKGYLGPPTDKITLPVQINGKAIVGIGKETLGLFKIVDIPYGIELLGDSFKNSRLEEVYFSEGVEVIPPYYFKDCSTLKCIYAPGVKEIHMGAFSGCTSLQAACFYKDYLDANASRDFRETPLLKNAMRKSQPLILGNVLLNGQGIVGDYTIPDNIKSICEEAFHGNVVLTSVKAGENLEYIGKGAFERCINMRSVDLSLSKLSDIRESAFASTYRLDTFKMPANQHIYIYDNAFRYSGIKNIDLSMARTIGFEAFSETRLEGEIKLPHIRKLDYSFERTGVERVCVPDNILELETSSDTEVIFMEEII